jgi:hypothetical protein
MEKVVDVVDLLGGIDVNVTYGFTTRDGIYYSTGPQHLDGEAVYSYTRFRKTFEGTDIKRTQRQRDVISALIRKIQQQNLYLRLPEILTTLRTAITPISTSPRCSGFCRRPGRGHGRYRTVYVAGVAARGAQRLEHPLRGQDARVKLLHDVYGIDAKPLPYCSFDYCEWLVGDGTAGNGALGVIRYLYVTQRIAAYAADAAETNAGIAAQRETLMADIEQFESAVLPNGGRGERL